MALRERFGVVAGRVVKYLAKFERPAEAESKFTEDRRSSGYPDRRFLILEGGPRRRHFANERGLPRAPCALARGFCYFGCR